jgi:hypothetical protein
MTNDKVNELLAKVVLQTGPLSEAEEALVRKLLAEGLSVSEIVERILSDRNPDPERERERGDCPRF